MKKYTMIGFNEDGNACILKCLIPFSRLVIQELEASDFTHESTNWGGFDSLDRTLSIRNLKVTGRKIMLVNPIRFTGFDSDHGHRYGWNFVIDSIIEVEEATSEVIQTKRKKEMTFREFSKDILDEYFGGV